MARMYILCRQHYACDPQHLAWVLENLAAGHVINQISVPKAEAILAKKALDNMLSIN